MTSTTILQRIADALNDDAAGDALPKYLLLHNQIMAAIEAGEWGPGERLPPETVFAKEIPLSLGTIQKALQMLADEGVVVRRHRDGTYVAGAVIIDEATIFRFLADDGAKLLPIYTYVLDVTRTDEAGPWSDFFAGESEFLRITRRVSVNLEFDVFNRVYMSAARFGTFLDLPLHQLHGASLVELLGERFNAPVLRTVQRMQIAALPAVACRISDIPDDTVGMVWEVLAYSYRDSPVTYQSIYLPPNGRRLEVREYKR